MSEITAKQSIPERYLEQILTDLRRGGVVKSHRGAKGGYMLVCEPWQINLLEVVTLMDGERKERESSEAPSLEKICCGTFGSKLTLPPMQFWVAIPSKIYANSGMLSNTRIRCITYNCSTLISFW